MYEATNNDNKESNELSEIYKIFKEIYLKAIPVLKDLSHNSIEIDYIEWINDKNKIDFNRIEQKFQDKKYSSITDAIQDIRLVFLNCYTFYGTKSDYTKQSLQLEELFEQEISCLNENIKPLADIQLTLNLLNLEENSNFKFRYPKDCYDSILLRRVAHCRPDRLKEYHKKISSMLTNDDDNIHTLDEITCWENEIYFNKNYQCISSMWELPEIGNFVAIIFKAYDIDIINQTEIERMFLMPKESTTMSKIMTVLLMPIKRTKVIEQVMPYSVWSKKLSKKVSNWYKVFHIKNQNKDNVMTSLGIHPDFWTIVGDKNPLVEYDYCELSYFMKVWLIKGLCDHITIKYKIINDLITNCNEKQCTIWKNDTETEEYFFYNSIPDLRIYYHNITHNEPSLEFLEMENSEEEKISMNEVLSIIDIPSIFHSDSRKKHNQNHFKLIADSVQGLRSFLEKLDIEDTSVPENLITSLENFIIKIEHEECNFIILNNNSIIRLFKDWKSYSERTNKDKTVLRGRRELKSISQGLRQEIILEKRKRKVVVKQGFANEITFDSDEYFTETDVEDYTDSEDEWGAMNQTKKKSKKPFKTHSKLVELEKRLKKGSKIPKPCKKSALDCGINNKLFETNEKENELNDEKQKENNISDICIMNTFNDCNENKLRDTFKTNTLVNGHNEKLISSDIIKSEEIKIDKISSGEEVLSILSEIEENKNACKKQKYIIESYKFITEQPDLKKMKLDNLENKEIVTIDDTFDKCKIIEKYSSENIVNDGNEQNHCTKMQPAKYNEKLNYPDIINHSAQIKISKISSGEEVLSILSEIEKNKNACKKQKYIIESYKFIAEQPDLKKVKLDNLENKEIVTIDDTFDKCKIIEKYSSENIVNDGNEQNHCTKMQPAKYNEQLNYSDIINNSEQIQIENITSGEEVISTFSKMEDNKNACKNQNYIIESDNFINKQPDLKIMKLKYNISENVEIVTIEDDKLDDCKIIEKDSSSKIVNDKNEQNHCTKIQSAKYNLKNDETISIEDDDEIDQIVISDDGDKNDDVQFVSVTSKTKNTSITSRTQNTSMTSITKNTSITPGTKNISDTPRTQNSSITLRTQNISVTPRTQNSFISPRIQNSAITPKIQNLPVKTNRSYGFNKSQSSTLENKQMTTTNLKKNQVITTSMAKLSPDVSIIPSNVRLPKSIEVTLIKQPHTTINSHFNSTKRSTTKSSGYPINNTSVVNVECRVMPEPNHKGEVTFYVSLPNGKKHKISDELMNEYLKEHNNRLPDYWLVPLPIEVAKQYGFY